MKIRGGHHKTLARGDNVVKDNHIHGYERWFRAYRPGVLWGGVGNLFSGNHIAHAPHNAFLGGANEAVCAREQQIGGSGGSLEPPGPLLESPGPLLTHPPYRLYGLC